MTGAGVSGRYARDLQGYGRTPPQARWPGEARVALQFVLNDEEGGENSVLHGDPGSEQFLSELFNPPAFAARYLSIESVYEYGSRVGVWRLLREFEQRGPPLTVFGVAMALERCPDVTAALVELGHEIACHGWRWISYQSVEEGTEREHMAQGMSAIEGLTGVRPLGWYTGRDSPNTRRLLAEYGGFEYDSDYYGDDLPFWLQVRKRDGASAAQLVVPYTLDCNDMRFALPQGFARRRLLCLPARCFRRALRRRRRATEHDERWHALPPARAARAPARIATIPGPCGAPRSGLDPAPHRHRATLEGQPSVRRRDGFRMGVTQWL
jgi:allantoinase